MTVQANKGVQKYMWLQLNYEDSASEKLSHCWDISMPTVDMLADPML